MCSGVTHPMMELDVDYAPCICWNTVLLDGVEEVVTLGLVTATTEDIDGFLIGGTSTAVLSTLFHIFDLNESGLSSVEVNFLTLSENLFTVVDTTHHIDAVIHA